MGETKQQEVINLREIASKIKSQRKKFILPLAITFVLSCIYIFSFPRFYNTESKLAPESESASGGSMLGSIASSFGFDLGEMQSSDAINPLLYPDLMDDNAFVCSLFDIKIEVNTEDQHLSTTYYDYLNKHQKSTWWAPAISWFKNLFKKKEAESSGKAAFDPYHLSLRQNDILMVIQGNVKLSVDKKTGVITINVTDQEPSVCKALSDSLIVKLQDYITRYRTNKARIDMVYYEQLVDSARRDYEEAYKRHARFSDANMNMQLTSYQNKRDALENEMQLKYSTYSALSAQLQAARSKVQERTPAFTLLKGAAVPVKPAGPKRMIFVGTMLFLVFVARAFWMVRKELHFTF